MAWRLENLHLNLHISTVVVLADLQIGPNRGHRNVVRVLADVVAIKLLHILFSQKGFAYDFEFLHAFLSNKKNKIEPKQKRGDPGFTTPQIVLSGQTADILPEGVCL